MIEMDTPQTSSSPRTFRSRGSDIHIRAALQMHEYEAIAERIAHESLGPVLDWGCGYGQMSDLLRKHEVEVTAFDWSANAASHHEVEPLERYPEIEIHRSSDPVKLPFPDNSFRCVLSCGVLEHVQQPGASLDELHRVLRPGGRLLIYKLPNRFSYLEVLARWLGIYYHGAVPNEQTYSCRSATALLSHHGFRVDAARRTNLLPLTISSRPAQALAGPLWATNRALGHVPLVRLLATNLELDATAQ